MGSEVGKEKVNTRQGVDGGEFAYDMKTPYSRKLKEVS